MSDSLHEANQDAYFEQQAQNFKDWVHDANLDEVFPDLTQIRTELLSEKGRITLCARIADSFEDWLDDQ